MAITISDTEPRVQYTATSGQTSFSVPFEFFTVNDIKVYNGTSLLSYNASPSSASQYSVTGAGVSGGGSITLGGGATLNDKITIFRDLAIARSTDFPTSGAFQISSLNDELDKIIAMCQQLERDLKFSPRAASTTASTYNLTFPELAANKILSVNSGGTALEFSQDITNVNTIAAIATDVSTVSGIAANVTSVAGNATNINTVASNITSVNTVAADITKVVAVANDLAETVSEIETVADDLNETTSEIDTVAANVANVNSVGNDIANVNTVAGAISNVNSVAGNATNINAVAGNATNINAVNSNSTNINTVAGDASDINTLAAISSDITTLAGTTGLTTLANNASNITIVANNNTNLSLVGNDIANVNTVATNISGVNSFGERYRVASSAPTSSTDVGDLYFDTTANELKVYKTSGWAAAGSTVNGTSQRYTYNITGAVSNVTGADANGNTLAYDAGYADVYVNGVRMSAADITITSGTSVVFASPLSNGDVVDIVAYGTFDVASINAANIDSGTLNIARIADLGITTAKLNTGAVTGDKIGADAVNGDKIADDSINSEHVADGSIDNIHLAGSIANNKLSNSSITINGSAVSLGGSVTVGETKPTITSLTPSVITNDPSNVVIAGANFQAIPRVHAINTSTGIWYEASTVTYTSASSITANFTLTVDSANYRIRVENPDGNAVISGASALNVSDAPAWTTAAGSLGSVAGDFNGTITTVAATGDTVTFTEVSSPLVLTNASQANCALSTAGVITTSDFGGSSTTATLYTFTIRATDAQGQTSDRVFTLQSSFGSTGGGQFN